MKIKVAILGMAITCIAGSVVAQETDDMYFNSTDRAKLNASKPQKTEALTNSDRNESAVTNADDENINATDYSARNVNPEFTSRSNSALAQEDNGDYFINDYRFAAANELNEFNNNYNNWSNSQWYNSGYYANNPMAYGSGMGMSSSYYYNSYANPWSSPYYQSGWYGSLSYYGGCPYYGNSMSMGMGYGSPYYGGYYGSGYGGGYYGGGYSGGGYYGGGGNSYVVVESGRGSVVGKRAERGGMAYNANSTPSRRTEISTRSTTSKGGNSSGGRVATSNSGRTQDEYYNRSWRRASEYQSQRTSTSNPSSGSNNNSSWTNSGSNNNSRSSSWGTGNSSSPAPSRSSSFESGGGSRSSGSSSAGSSSGSGSGGRTRGRD